MKQYYFKAWPTPSEDDCILPPDDPAHELIAQSYIEVRYTTPGVEETKKHDNLLQQDQKEIYKIINQEAKE